MNRAIISIIILFTFSCSSESENDLRLSMGTIDQRYDRGAVLPGGATAFSGVAWRGERLNAQVVLSSSTGAKQVTYAVSPFTGAGGRDIPAAAVHPAFVGYVLSDDGSQRCEETDFGRPGKLVADVLDTSTSVDIEAGVAQPVWVSIDVPMDAEPGNYEAAIRFEGTGTPRVELGLRLEVLPRVLPPPAEWSFHLDLWQNPGAVARYYSVEPWSEEHIKRLEPLLDLLAGAGQKVITTTITHQPWGGQVYDPYDSMVRWVRGRDGSWSYDYTVFDRYVELAIAHGIGRQINCYSMVSWANRYRYWDEAAGDYVTVEAAPGTADYAGIWEPFLVDFTRHLKEKGWLDRTAIAMDEREHEQMKAAVTILKRTAPALNVSLAGSYIEDLDTDLHDVSYYIKSVEKLADEIVPARRRRGQVSTFYTSCSSGEPNNYSYSPPAAPTWQGWYAAAHGFDGMLRWAFNSWVEEPLKDTRYIKFPAGDCFQIYPGPRSSIRFERLRDGIEDYEKIRILRDSVPADALQPLTNALDAFKLESTDFAGAVNNGQRALETISRTAQ